MKLWDCAGSSGGIWRSLCNTSDGSGPLKAVEDCLNPETMGLRCWERSEMFESLETSESEEPLGEWRVARCWEVIYGPRLLDVRFGRGEYGLLLGWGDDAPEL
jgi:hypothetical protein